MIKTEYLCTCGNFLPLLNLYFCRHCAKLRCRTCVLYEIDAYYCPQCLENVPSTEARIKNNMCSNCYQCPICFSLLLKKCYKFEEEGGENKKVFYLSCESCLWSNKATQMHNFSSENQPIFDQEDADKHKVIDTQFEKLTNFYQELILKNNIMDSLTLNLGTKLDDYILLTQEVKEEFLYGTPLSEVSTLKQRFLNPSNSSNLTKKLHPSRIHFKTKLTIRCNECQHFIIKPDLKPGSIKFKVDQMALYYIPEIRPNLFMNMNLIIIVIKNSALFDRTIQLSTQLSDENNQKILQNIDEEVKKQNFFDYFDFSDTQFPSITRTISESNVQIKNGQDVPEIKLEKTPAKDLEESYVIFQKLNYDIYKQIQTGKLSEETLLYQQLNRAALRLNFQCDQVENAENQSNINESLKSNNDTETQRNHTFYCILSHNYSNPTLTTLTTKTEKMPDVSNGGTTILPKPNSENILHHLVKITF